MAITIVNKVQYTATVVQGSFTIPTATAGNILVLLLAINGTNFILNNPTLDPIANQFGQQAEISEGNNLAAAYVTTAIGGENTINFHYGEAPRFWYYELSGNNLSVDVSGTASSTSSSTSAPGPSLAGTGANEFYATVCAIGGLVGGSITAVSSPWTLDTLSGGGFLGDFNGAAYLNNSSGTRQATFTQSPAGDFASAGLSVKEGAASACTVSGTMQTAFAAGLQGNAFVRFRLRGFTGKVPRILGVSVIVEPQLDVLPNASGFFSTPLWANANIDPAGTFYAVEYWNNGRITHQANYIITCPTDLDTALPIPGKGSE